jgi:hypothetical protein
MVAEDDLVVFIEEVPNLRLDVKPEGATPSRVMNDAPEILYGGTLLLSCDA